MEGRLGTKYRTGKISEKNFWERAKDYWKINAPSDTLSLTWLQSYKPLNGTVKIVKRLKKARYKLIFLSDNVQERVHYLEQKYGFSKDFKDGVFSHVAKIRKPNFKIYKMALKKTRSLPGECVFIDDKPHFLKPAKKLGMRTIAFRSPKHLESELRKLGLKF